MNTQTLADRIAAERITVSDGLHIAMLVAEQLKEWHDGGMTHGRLTPSAIALDGYAAQLLAPGETRGSAAYVAPEVRQGAAPDARSDIFSFGAIVYEMLAGRPAFEDGFPTARPLESGSVAIDHLVNGCVALSPDNRYQRMQKLILELRLLLSTAKRSNTILTPPERRPVVEQPVEAAPEPAAIPMQRNAPFDADRSAMHAIQDLEGRISARLHEQERTIANVAEIANEVLKALRQQQAGAVVASQPAPQPLPVMTPPPAQVAESNVRGMGFRGFDELSTSHRMDRMLDLISDKLSRLDMVVTSAVDRIQKLEDMFDQFDIDAAALRDSVTRDIRGFERALKSQSAIIESARTAMGQTDDLVERVVEAIDSLQATFVTSAEERLLAS